MQGIHAEKVQDLVLRAFGALIFPLQTLHVFYQLVFGIADCHFDELFLFSFLRSQDPDRASLCL